MPVTDDSAQEKAMEKLRSTAQSTPVPPGRKGRPPADIASEPSPKEAAWLLGLLALHGKAMPFDPVQAQHWFERAYLLGNPLAAAGLAWCQMDNHVHPVLVPRTMDGLRATRRAVRRRSRRPS